MRSGMVPFERAYLISYKPSIVSPHVQSLNNEYSTFSEIFTKK